MIRRREDYFALLWDLGSHTHLMLNLEDPGNRKSVSILERPRTERHPPHVRFIKDFGCALSIIGERNRDR